MFFLLFLFCSAAMAQEPTAIVYSTEPECVSGTTEIWVNQVGDIQQSVGKLIGGEAKDFKVTGTLTIGNKTLEEYIKSVIDEHIRL